MNKSCAAIGNNVSLSWVEKSTKSLVVPLFFKYKIKKK